MLSMNIGIVTTWFERGAAYVSRAYYETLSKQCNVFIYARGGESFGTGDPNWDIPNIKWTTLNSVKIDKNDFIKWIDHNQIKLILFNEQEHWWPPVIWANEVGVHTVT
jgi:1,2-diacylglycerol 3-alpha-glucosyltransferase